VVAAGGGGVLVVDVVEVVDVVVCVVGAGAAGAGAAGAGAVGVLDVGVVVVGVVVCGALVAEGGSCVVSLVTSVTWVTGVVSAGFSGGAAADGLTGWAAGTVDAMALAAAAAVVAADGAIAASAGLRWAAR
jgi:hypothetical protein